MIEDIAGIRIICQFEEDIDTVASIIRSRSDMTASSYGHKILLHNCISINIAPCRIVALKLRLEIRKDKTSHTV